MIGRGLGWGSCGSSVGLGLSGSMCFHQTTGGQSVKESSVKIKLCTMCCHSIFQILKNPPQWLVAQDILAGRHSARSSLRPERWRSPLSHASYHRPGNPGYETGLDLSINEDGWWQIKHICKNYSPHPPDDQVNQRPALAQFLCLKNIRLFLASCTKYHHHHHYYHKYSLGNSSKQATISGSTTCGKPICSSRRCFTTTQTLPK